MWFMADRTLSSRTTIRPYRARGSSPRIVTFDASTCANAAALIKSGQVVQFDATSSATHRLVQASTGANPNLSTNFVGIACGNDTSDGSTTGQGEGKRPISVWAAEPNTEFLFPTNVAGTTPGLVNTAMALKWDSTLGIHYAVANSTAGETRITVTEVPDWTVGDTNGFVVGRFLSTAVAIAISPR
jgi:hypothetical protein